MKKLYVDNVEIEITEQKAALLNEADALVEHQDGYMLNMWHSFTVDEVIILLNPGE
jgi:hypothetical protein